MEIYDDKMKCSNVHKIFWALPTFYFVGDLLEMPLPWWIHNISVYSTVRKRSTALFYWNQVSSLAQVASM